MQSVYGTHYFHYSYLVFFLIKDWLKNEARQQDVWKIDGHGGKKGSHPVKGKIIEREEKRKRRKKKERNSVEKLFLEIWANLFLVCFHLIVLIKNNPNKDGQSLKGRGGIVWHATEVAFMLSTQLARVWFTALPRFFSTRFINGATWMCDLSIEKVDRFHLVLVASATRQ